MAKFGTGRLGRIMKTSDFDYPIPRELVAQEPMEPRDHSRLLVLNKTTGEVTHTFFYDLPSYLGAGDILVLNNSKVIPVRLKCTQGLSEEVTILLLRKVQGRVWEMMVEVGECEEGEELVFSPDLSGKVIGLGEVIGKRKERLGNILLSGDNLDTSGSLPIPPYIHSYRGDPNRYQTVYASKDGSAAAPTAGFHFTPHLLDEIKGRGVQVVEVTLHVSIDTFMPVYEDDPEGHKIHKEWVEVKENVIDQIFCAGRLIGVGTTSVRSIEQVWKNGYPLNGDYRDWADIYILPGHEFHIDGMITNFHYPRSTNLMMVAAFAGWDKLKPAYEEAIKERYRLYSFGDSMFII